MAGNSDDAQIAMLNKVLDRLLSTPASKLEAILDKLLPRLVIKLAGSEAVRNKTVELLTHINRRVQGDESLVLNCDGLIKVYQQHADSAFVRNFTLLYLEMGFPRLSVPQKGKMVEQLIPNLAKIPEEHQSRFLQIILKGLPHVIISGDPLQWGRQPETSDDDFENDRKVLLDFFMDVALYAPKSNEPAAPAGLTIKRMRRLQGFGSSTEAGAETPKKLTAAQVAENQLAVLHLLDRRLFKPEHDIAVYIAARGAALRSDVWRVAEEGISIRAKSLNYNSAELVENVADLILGYSTAEAVEKGRPWGQRTSVENVVKVRFMRQLLMKSKYFATIPVLSVRVFLLTAFDPSSSDELRILGLQLSQRISTFADLSGGNQSASLILTGLRKVVVALQTEKLSQTRELDRQERDAAYMALGALAAKKPQLFKDDLELVILLLNALRKESDSRVSVQECLGKLCPAFSATLSGDEGEGASEAVRNQLLNIILSESVSEEPKSRFVAADWARRLWPFDNNCARFVCLILSCDSELAVREAAMKGLLPALCNDTDEEPNKMDTLLISAASRHQPGQLGLVWTDKKYFEEENKVLLRKEHKDQFPLFDSWVKFINSGEQMRILMSLNPPKQASVLGFAAACLGYVDNTEQHQSSIDLFRANVETAMGRELTTGGVRVKPATLSILHRVASECLVKLVENNPSSFQASSISEPSWLLKWLGSDSQIVRENISKLSLYFPQWLQSRPEDFALMVKELVKRMKSKLASALNARHGAILASGSLLSEGGSMSKEQRQELCTTLCKTLLDQRGAFRVVMLSCVQAIGVAYSSGPLDISVKDRIAATQAIVKMATKSLESSASDTTNVGDSESTELVECSLKCLGQIGCGEDNPELRLVVLEALFKSGEEHKSPYIHLIVGKALADISSGPWMENQRLKNESTAEAAAAAGEPPNLEHEPLRYIMGCMVGPHPMEKSKQLETEKEKEKERTTPIAKSALNRLRAAYAIWLLFIVKKNSASPFIISRLGDLQESFALLLREREEVTREAAARGLAITYEIAATLPEPESESRRKALISSLNRNLAARRDLSAEDIKKMKQNKDPSGESDAKNENVDSNADKETKKEDEPDMANSGNVSGRALTTEFKEMYALAVRVKKIDLVYYLFYLSCKDPLWTTNGALPISSELYENRNKTDPVADENAFNKLFAYGPEVLDELVPVLYRYKNDSLEVIRLAMEKLWENVVSTCPDEVLEEKIKLSLASKDNSERENRKKKQKLNIAKLDFDDDEELIRKHNNASSYRDKLNMRKTRAADIRRRRQNRLVLAYFQGIMSELIKGIGSSDFRERHSAAVGTLQVLRNSEISSDEVLEYLEDMWEGALRLTDDMNKNTKLVSIQLVNQLAKLSVYLCTVDTSKSLKASENDFELAKNTLDIVLPFLVHKGLELPSKDAQMISMQTLVKVTEAAGHLIEPHIADVTATLLQSMSALEEQMLSYAMFHTEDQGGELKMSKDQLEMLRIQAAAESPMQKAINTCMQKLDIEKPDTIDDLADRLTIVLRSGVGLPTLAATSKVVTQLYGNKKITPPLLKYSKKFLTTLAHQLNDRSMVLKNIHVSTAATICKAAMPSEKEAVLSYLEKLVEFYYEPGDRAARFLTCKAIKQVCHQVPRQHLKSISYSIIPLMFMARNDYDENSSSSEEDTKFARIGENFQDLWLENSDLFNIKEHLELIIDNSLKSLKRTTWLHKRQGAEAISAMVPIAAEDLVPYSNDMIRVLAEMLPGRVWAGKESIPIALSRTWQLAVENYSASQIEKEAEWATASDLIGGIFFQECTRSELPVNYHRALYEAMSEIAEKERIVKPDTEIQVTGGLIKLVDALVKKNYEILKADLTGSDKNVETLTAAAVVSLGRSWPRRCQPRMQLENYEDCIELFKSAMKGTSWVVHMGAMTALRDLVRYSIIAEALNEANMGKSIDLALTCIQQNKNPRVIVAALQAILAALEKANGPVGVEDSELDKTAVEILKKLLPICKNKVQRLLSHNEPTVVHTASLIENQANKIMKSKVFSL